MVGEIAPDEFINRDCGDAGLQHLRHFGKRFADEQRAFSHELNFLFVLIMDHSSYPVQSSDCIAYKKNLVSTYQVRSFITVPSALFLLVRSLGNCSALDTSALHQPVVLPHQQLRFDLLQGIEDNTYHDEQ